MSLFFPLPQVKPPYFSPVISSIILSSSFCLSLHTTTRLTHHWLRNLTKWDCVENPAMLRKIQMYSSPSQTKYQLGISSMANGCQLSDEPYFVDNHVIYCSHWEIHFQSKRSAINNGANRDIWSPSSPCDVSNSELLFSHRFYTQCPDFPFSESLRPLLLLPGRWLPSVSLYPLRSI